MTNTKTKTKTKTKKINNTKLIIGIAALVIGIFTILSIFIPTEIKFTNDGIVGISKYDTYEDAKMNLTAMKCDGLTYIYNKDYCKNNPYVKHYEKIKDNTEQTLVIGFVIAIIGIVALVHCKE